MGSVHPYDSAKGRKYLVRYRKPDGTNGAKRGFSRKRDAELWLADVESSRARGEFIDPKAARVTINSLGPGWIESKSSSMKPSSFAPVETAWRLRVQPTWGRWALSDIRHSDIKDWVGKLSKQVGATVTIRTFGVLAGILDDAVHDKRISLNPARVGDIPLPRKKKRTHRYLSHEQVAALARASGSHRLLVLVLAYTGIRWAEVTGLRVRHIDFERGRLRIEDNAVEVGNKVHLGTPKSHKSRAVPVPRFVLEQLRLHTSRLDGDALVFAGRDGGYMRRTRASEGSRSWFKVALKEANLPLMTPHDLRHTAASLAVQSGAHVKTIQRMLGHASAAMTLDVYSDLFDDDLDLVSIALDAAASRSGVLNLFSNEDEAPEQRS
tara:strand:+ start:1846 stop:2985 length:1140 start_codon:yes stop_codon:yes gene_type:complete